jgi:type I restriction enzyme S subunit
MNKKAKTPNTKNSDNLAFTPKLRFPEFQDTDGWEKRSLGLVCQMQAGKFVSASEIQEYHAKGLYPCYGGNGLRGYTSTFTHSGKYSLIGRQGALCGNVRIGVDQFHATEHAVVVTPENGVNGDWLFYVLDFLNLNRFATGQAQPGLSVDVLEKLPIAIPNQELEQRKISECFCSVDELIAADMRKLDALKAQKKGLTQQLFPREGEPQPRLRFLGLREQWVETPLDNLCSSISSGRDQMETDGTFDLYGSTSVIGKTRNPSFSGERILVARVGANAGLLTKASGQYGVTDNTLVVSPHPSINIDYLFHYLATININRLIFGSGQPLITGSILKNLRVLLPSDSEQAKISACLSSLDQLINYQSSKIQALNTHKKGLMQQLFPSPLEVEA